MTQPFDPGQFLRFKTYRGFQTRGLPWNDTYKARVDYELGVIKATGFENYFLIVADFCNWMEENGIMFIARGSGCGSCVVWGLGISHGWLDPIKYDIPFERFLNPERISNPDLDIDIADDRRADVVEYCRQKYGTDRVAKVVTFGTLGGRAAIKDVARAQNIPDYQKVASTIATAIPQKKGTLIADTVAASQFLQEQQRYYPELFEGALRVEGRPRHTGQHASALIIMPDKHTKYLPLSMKHDENGESTSFTQWDMYDTEKRGLLKMDFLGSTTLQIIDQTVRTINLVNQSQGITQPFILDSIPRNDPTTWRMLSEGKTAGIFQIEKGFCQQYARRMNLAGEQDFFKLAVFVAIIRPGMMDTGQTEAYLRRASGVEVADPMHPLLAKTFAKTFGLMCIHEDAMILQWNGIQKPIKEIAVGDRVQSCAWGQKEIRENDVLWAGKTRFGEGVKITLTDGTSLIATPDHPIFTPRGEVEAGRLMVGGLVAVANRSLRPQDAWVDPAPFGSDRLGADEDVAYLLGQIVGDGCMKSSGTRIATGSEDAADRLAKWIGDHLPRIRVHKMHSTRCWYLQLSTGELANLPHPQNRKTILGQLTTDMGVRCGAKLKRIPYQILRASKEVKWAFVAGLMDSDGSIAESVRGHCTANYTSPSKELIDELDALCLQEGIPTSRYPNKLFMWDTIRLEELIGSRLVVKRFVGRRTCGERARGLVEGDIRFLKIRSIVRVQNQQFYDITVRNDHNFFANKILSHNCFQEDVMNAAKDLAGFSIPEADTLRKGVGKKQKSFIDKMKPQWTEGALQPRFEISWTDKEGKPHNLVTKPRNPYIKKLFAETPFREGTFQVSDGTTVTVRMEMPGATQLEADDIWTKIEAHARYSFNNAHALAYGMVAYWTAFLKANFPLHYLTHMINAEAGVGNKEEGYNYKVSMYVEEAKSMGLKVSPPCVRMSRGWCSMEPATNTIRFGLSLIKNISGRAVDYITREMPKCNSFKDFILAGQTYEEIDRPATEKKAARREWTTISRVSKRDHEHLILGGACDIFGLDRAVLLEALPPLQDLADSYHAQVCKERNGVKTRLRSATVLEDFNGFRIDDVDPRQPMSLEQKLHREREVTGCFLSHSPFEPFRHIINQFQTVTPAEIADGDISQYGQLIFVGMLSEFREHVCQNGKSKGKVMAFMNFVGTAGNLETPCFPDLYAGLKAQMGCSFRKGAVYCVQVKLDRGGESYVMTDVRLLSGTNVSIG